MDGSEEASGWAARSSASGAPGAAYPASSSSLGLVRHRRRTLVREEDEFEEEEVEAAQEHVSRILCSADKGRGGDADVSLREWLDRPGRAVDLLECLHIFRQIAEAVGSAHGQGVVVANVRPSCFVMSPLNSVSFIESASCSTSGSVSASSSDDDDAAAGSGLGPPERNRSFYGPSSSTRLKDRREADGAGEQKTFPLKRILLMEWSWYTSPEDADGVCPGTFASDVYRLGVLLFELFCTFDSLEEKLTTMADLRHRVLPPQLLLKWPKEASFCLWLLHPQPDTRPKISEVLRSEFLNRPTSKLEERVAAIKLTEEIEDEELLLEFLLHLKQRKQEVADRLHDSICFISADVQEVQDQRSILLQNSYPELDRGGRSSTSMLDHPVADVNSSCFASRKRSRSEFNNGVSEEELSHLMAEAPRSGTELQIQLSIASKSSRLMKNFKKLEAAYFSTRRRGSRSTRRPESKHLQGTSSGTGSAVRTERSSVDDVVLKEGRGGGRRNEWINPFLEGLCKYLSFSSLKVKADLKQGDLLNSMNLVCSMGFDRDNEFFATAGVNKKIKVFECDMILNEDRGIHYPVVEMSNRSKLSCICWNGYIKSQIASSDFEGVVQVWDVTRSQSLAEMREHEKRVWTVDFSLADPTRLASGGDDGTIKLWSINKAGSVGTIRTKANVCSIQFQPESAHSLAVGSADHKVYCFDLRNLRMPCCTLAGHTKTVSYVKHLDSSHVVSASTDNSLKLWNLPASTPGVLEAPLQTFAGHTNNKNFVGLSVSDGYIATGSETNEVFIYHKAFPMPVLSYKFSTTDPISGQENDDTSQFVSCVCWRGQSSTLLAANSSGNIKFLEMV
ncbi:Protein SUPPRESSOR OF PHYA-105 [Musa troglodytarum]|uniref:Protein SUPPRESSOR OF PHYA-105 n=1 Tax=Musa troglodytarum TaxID=320322 RepID=A0A9E7ECW3_9LILI|nr:Protein SUPPRESSOR OF PHYA-105 [Musa troglodytarum]